MHAFDHARRAPRFEDLTAEVYVCSACGMAQIPMRVHSDECPVIRPMLERFDQRRAARMRKLRAAVRARRAARAAAASHSSADTRPAR